MLSQFQKKLVSFGFLASVALILLVNMFITIWIITTIGLNIDGLSYLTKGPHLATKGNIYLMKALFAQHIRGQEGLFLQGSHNISIAAFSADYHHSILHIAEQDVTLATQRFVVKDPKGQTIFSSDPHTSKLMAKNVHIRDEGHGFTFKSSIETQKISSGPGNSLDIASMTGKLKLNGPQRIDLVSFGGDIRLNALDDIHIRAKAQGQISISSGSIKMPGLARSHNRTTGPVTDSSVRTVVEAYQMCACQDGRLFMTSAQSQCLADYHICRSST